MELELKLETIAASATPLSSCLASERCHLNPSPVGSFTRPSKTFLFICWLVVNFLGFGRNVFVTAVANNRWISSCFWRGGASLAILRDNLPKSSSKRSLKRNYDTGSEDDRAYYLLATSIRSHLQSPDADSLPEISKIMDSFKILSSSQQTFKGLDGAAHEAYQRTHSSSSSDDSSLTSVSGRARRSAARTGAVADGLFACELCEFIENPNDLHLSDSLNGTLSNREVLVNITNVVQMDQINISILVLFESSFKGGAGIRHGGIEELSDSNQHTRSNGRLLVIIGDSAANRLDATLRILSQKPRPLQLFLNTDEKEVAAVQPSLYRMAASVLAVIEPELRMHNTSAVHFTGRSLAGGIASLAALMLHGDLPVPDDELKRIPNKRRSAKNDKMPQKQNKSTPGAVWLSRSLQGFGKGRTSATVLGSPPCMSSNIRAPFVTSILYGDDIVCRASNDSLERLISRTLRVLKNSEGFGGLIGKQLSRMTDTVSLAASNLQSHAFGSGGNKLTQSGKAYLLRPRRLGGSCSIHEIGAHQLQGGRALRASILWQLNDVLLSKSLWKHHQLDSYIHGLDRVHLREIDEAA